MRTNFSVKNKVAVITGAGGVLGGSLAKHFISQGAKVAALDIRREQLDVTVDRLRSAGGDAMGFVSDVLDYKKLKTTTRQIVDQWGTIDILINVAGGNLPGATLREDQTVFDMKLEDWQKVTDLNLNGTVYPTLAMGRIMAEKGSGSIINVSSMAAYSAITRVLGYSVAKTGVINFTQWMAMEMALKFSEKIRVNAIAPGFFIGDQNRAVLLHPDGSLTDRSKKVLARTPMKRFGD
ncbi:MAG: SDR family NAD(P)-dependent oxidoreductase, partial [Bacteroidales bacterium]